MRNTRSTQNIAGMIHHGGYRYVEINGINYAAHRIVWKLLTNEEPPNQIDHINGVRSDNRWLNLRKATEFEQAQNRGLGKDNTSGYKNVNQDGTRWRVRIADNGVRRHLGYFATREEANAVYETAARKLHGEFFRPTQGEK